MSRFEVHYKHSISYEEKVELDICFDKRPTKEEYQSILDAIDTLSTIAKKYVIIIPTTKEK